MGDENYYVISENLGTVGPISSSVVAHMASKWEIGPKSPIRMGEKGEWMCLRDVADSVGIQLPNDDEWEARKKAARSKRRSDMILMGLIVIGAFWGLLAFLGLGFLFTPLAMSGILFVGLCKAFNPIAGTDVLATPMWTDMRTKPIKGQGWQLLAFALAAALTAAYYLWRMSGE